MRTQFSKPRRAHLSPIQMVALAIVRQRRRAAHEADKRKRAMTKRSRRQNRRKK